MNTEQRYPTARLIYALGVPFLIAQVLTVSLEWWMEAVALLIVAILMFFVLTINRYYNTKMLLAYVSLLFVVILVFSSIYTHYGVIDTQTDCVVRDPKISNYFSIVTLTTLGYGDFKPTVDARPYAAAEALIGMSYMSMLIALLFGRVSRPWYQSEEFSNK